MRQCMVMFNNKMQKGFFHTFGCTAGIIPPSLMRGGHPGGQVITTYALIELEDGTIYKADPDKVVFLDTAALMSEYDWGEETQDTVTEPKTSAPSAGQGWRGFSHERVPQD